MFEFINLKFFFFTRNLLSIFFHDHEREIKALNNKLDCPGVSHRSIYGKH